LVPILFTSKSAYVEIYLRQIASPKESLRLVWVTLVLIILVCPR
jgi:hypothetical protein